MQVGDLVKFRGSIGVIVELHSSYPHGTAEVQWIEGDRVWYTTDRLQKVTKCK
jgi:hypothetical protein